MPDLLGTPLYAYARRRGHNEHDAKDLVQGFFAQLFEHQSIRRVARDRGKFRSFLLGSLNFFIADQRDLARAQKRGGGREIVSIDGPMPRAATVSSRWMNGVRTRFSSAAGR